MNINQIEAKVKSIDKSNSDFIYELLHAHLQKIENICQLIFMINRIFQSTQLKLFLMRNHGFFQ